MKKAIVKIALVVTAVVSFPLLVSAQETYRFERMWPTLQQSWNFMIPNGTAFDAYNNFYVADSVANRIVKLNQDGFYITAWGREGSAEGEFSIPIGVAVDAEGNVYVTEQGNNRVQKFDANGTFIIKWGQQGAGERDLNTPAGIAVDGLGNVYVADTENNRIQKYNSNGENPLTFAAGLNRPYDVAVDSSNYVYVADTYNSRVLKYTAAGILEHEVGNVPPCTGFFSFPIDIDIDAAGNIYIAGMDNSIWKLDAQENCVDLWGGSYDEEAEDGKFFTLNSIAIDTNGYVYATDALSTQKFTPDGEFIIRWCSFGGGAGVFNQPSGAAVDTAGFVYVADLENHRIQKFSPDGEYAGQWGEQGSGDAQFGYLWGIATDAADNVFVVDPGNSCIKKFNSAGDFLVKWGRYGSGEDQFEYPAAIAVDKSGNVFVTDVWSYTRCIRKFKPTPDGTGGIDNSGYEFAASWGTYSYQPDPLPGEFMNPSGIAVDGEGNVYVADRDNSRIQKFKPTPDGTGGIDNSGYEIDIIWGRMGTDPGEFLCPYGIAVDNEANVYVTDTLKPRVQKFDSAGNFITTWGETGIWAGQFKQPEGIAVSSEGRVYVTDRGHNRVQVFKKHETSSRPRAIIVAGGGPGDNLWNAIQVCTNFAYRTLTYQGYTRDEIYYLTSDWDLDLDTNGVSDDVDNSPSIANLQSAITQWAVDENADSLLLYLNDHGGSDTFKINGTEILEAPQLASWLDELQASTSVRITAVYEACESGSFIDNLYDLQRNDRIIITSTLPGEQAKFLSMGTISFSYFFWSNIFNGLSIGESYGKATKMVNFSFSNQNPQLKGDAAFSYLGNHAPDMISDAPEIGTISGPQDLEEQETAATLYADGVTDPDGIARVWAVIWPPDFNPDASNPLLGLDFPTCELLCDVENSEDASCPTNRYVGSYSNFTTNPTTYQIAIYAMDKENNITLPQLTAVSRNYPVTRRAVIIAGGSSTSVTHSMIEANAENAYNALTQQLYEPEDIYFMSVPPAPAGADDDPSIDKLRNHLNNLAGNGNIDNLDLVIYFIGAGDTGEFSISNTETLPASALDRWLDDLQAAKPGSIKIIYDGDKSGSFIAPLATPEGTDPPVGSERIIITSSWEDGAAYFSGAGDICFSSFFWGQVAGGATLYNAFSYARQAISYLSLKNEISFSCYPPQNPLLDADWDGKTNRTKDYETARARTIGIGLKFAADPPAIESASVEEDDGVVTITAVNVISTSQIQRVWAEIKPIAYCPGSSGEETQKFTEVDLAPSGDGDYAGTYAEPLTAFKVSVYAMDEDGNTSDSQETKIYQEGGDRDIYEDPDVNGVFDDDPAEANVIVINYPSSQPHTFHYEGDEDWVKFYGKEGQEYTVEADNLDEDCSITIELYRKANLEVPIAVRQSSPGDDYLQFEYPYPESDIYYVRMSLDDACVLGEGISYSYDLSVYDNNLGLTALVAGEVDDLVSGNPIDGAVIISSGVGAAISTRGEYILSEIPGSWTISSSKESYVTSRDSIRIEADDEYIINDFSMYPVNASGCVNADDCNDGIFCNGVETCVNKTCQSGTSPCAADGIFCNGAETCDEQNDSCGHAGDPCQADLTCDEERNACVGCLEDAQCDDGLFCTGAESCLDGACQAGTYPCPEGVVCDEETDECMLPTLTVTPRAIMQSHWMPLPVFMSIRGTNTHFGSSSSLTFNPRSVMALPMMINPETIFCFGLMMPAWITQQAGESLEVRVTTGPENATGSVEVRLLPFLLREGKQESEDSN